MYITIMYLLHLKSGIKNLCDYDLFYIQVDSYCLFHCTWNKKTRSIEIPIRFKHPVKCTTFTG